MSYWTNLGHVSNTETVTVVTRLKFTDWPISDHTLTPELGQPSCREQLHGVWERDGSSNIY